jgi:isoquinoline 1-oxidoreductase
VSSSGRRRPSRTSCGVASRWGWPRAATRLRQEYAAAYIAHAPLEPRAAVAEWWDGKLTVWTGTQRPFGVRGELAEVFQLPEERVRVIVPDTGSGYGGKHTRRVRHRGGAAGEGGGEAREAGLDPRGRVHLGYFRPAGLIEIASGADKDGRIIAWECHNYNSGAAGIRTPYAVPNQHIEFHAAESPLRQGSYRALASTANHFAREVHMDELARG